MGGRLFAGEEEDRCAAQQRDHRSKKLFRKQYRRGNAACQPGQDHRRKSGFAGAVPCRTKGRFAQKPDTDGEQGCP